MYLPLILLVKLLREPLRDRVLVKTLKRDVQRTWRTVYKKYYNLGFREDDLYREIIKASQRSRDAVNRYFGLCKVNMKS